jgi:hypothetical protein
MSVQLLTVSHSLFLTREQRYALQVPEAEIEVIGSCSPVWVIKGEHITKIAEEVFAKYRFRHCPEPEKHTITFLPEGFMVKLSPDMPYHLTDISDGGSACLSLTHKNVIEMEGKVAPVVHYFNVDDIRILEETLC